MIINHLENKIKKISKNLQFLHFVLKKIVSLQLDEKSSDFRYTTLFVKSGKFQNGTRTQDLACDAGKLVCSNGKFPEPHRRIV